MHQWDWKKRLRYAFLPQRFILGRQVTAHDRFLQKSERWPKEQLAEYQLGLLHRLVRHAYDNCTFYQRRFKEIGLEPGDIKSFDDYRRIPTITKHDVHEHVEEIKARDFESYNPIETRTGGTTGSPLLIYHSQESSIFRDGMHIRLMRMADLKFTERKLSCFAQDIKGDVPSAVSYVPIYNLNLLEIHLSHLHDDNLAQVVDCIRKFRPKAYRTGIEYMRVLNRYAERHGITDLHLPNIFVQGEMVYDQDREVLRKNFGANIFDYFGLRENTVSAGDCVFSNMHINAEFTYVEFENEHGPVGPGEQGEMIGTNLLNLAFPLLRYKTGDIARPIEIDCPCGRNLPVMRVQGGRMKDYLTARDRVVQVSHHYTVALEITDGIEKLQFYQPDYDNVVVRIVKNGNYSDADGDKLLASLRKWTEGLFSFSIEFVDDIPRTPLGKYRYIVSDLYPSIEEAAE